MKVRPTSYPPRVAAKIAGVPPQWLSNWKHRGILMSSVEPHHYSFRDLVAIRALVALKGLGVDLGGCIELAAFIQTKAPLDSTFIVANGRDVFAVDDATAVRSLLRRGRPAFCAIALQGIAEELHEEARALGSAAA